MKLFLIGLLIHGSLATSAWAFNEKGHMTVARLAWQLLDPGARSAATEILKAHPHYQEYLAAQKPEEFTVDEWVFLRASYWPDWIRSNHSDDFHRPNWHYITAAFIPSRSQVKPPTDLGMAPNVVTQISECQQKIAQGTAAEKAISLCWLLHLVGDVHQPLHNATLYDETYPEGDRGGNLGLVRFNGGEPMRLHAFWDGALGEDASPAAVLSIAAELEKMLSAADEATRKELEQNQTPESWSKEGFALACEFAYLKGDLKLPRADTMPAAELVPNLTDAYVAGATNTAKRAAAKAGRRLADRISASLAPKQ